MKVWLQINSLLYSERLITILFSLLIVSFPFGSHIFAFSIGFMTIYPFLVLLLVLTFISFFHINKIASSIEKYFLFFLVFWFAYALIQFFFIDGKSDAIIDLRNLFLMLLVTFVFISTKYIVGLQKWADLIGSLFKLIFIVFLLIAILEMLTTVHFVGEFTQKILELPERGILINPVFVYDNPNNFCVYELLCGVIILLTEKNIKEKGFLVFFILGVCLFFGYAAESRLVPPALIFTIIILVFFVIKGWLKFKMIRIKFPVFFGSLFMVLLVYLISIKQKFHISPEQLNVQIERYHQKRQQQDTFSQVKIGLSIASDTLSETHILRQRQIEDSLAAAYQTPIAAEAPNPDDLILMSEIPTQHLQDSCFWLVSSNSTRKGLALNGIDFLMRSNFFGVGPGQYRHYHQTGQIKYYVRKNNGPHFWMIEIFSQYGIIIFALYIGFFAWMKLKILKSFKQDILMNSVMGISLFVFFIASILPSGFLILDINWIFVAVFIAVFAQRFTNKVEELVG